MSDQDDDTRWAWWDDSENFGLADDRDDAIRLAGENYTDTYLEALECDGEIVLPNIYVGKCHRYDPARALPSCNTIMDWMEEHAFEETGKDDSIFETDNIDAVSRELEEVLSVWARKHFKPNWFMPGDREDEVSDEVLEWMKKDTAKSPSEA